MLVYPQFFFECIQVLSLRLVADHIFNLQDLHLLSGSDIISVPLGPLQSLNLNNYCWLKSTN